MKFVIKLFLICFFVLPSISWGTPAASLRTPQEDANRIIANSFAGCGSVPSAPSDSVLTTPGRRTGAGPSGVTRPGGASRTTGVGN